MDISRRSFLGLSVGALAGFTLDPERLLWRPGARTILLPSPSQSLYYSTIIVGGLVQRGARITPFQYQRALGKSIVWADDGNRRIDVSFPWVDIESARGVELNTRSRIIDLSVSDEIAPQQLVTRITAVGIDRNV
jgi:hypothetical protein